MAHVTDLGFTMDELHEAMAAGDIRRQTHPEFPELAIYNYGEEVQYKNKWNKITLACRGLILDTVSGEVIARPWEKFFNFGQMDNRIESTGPVEVTDKLDGSLGILYKRPDGEWAIATRGSFASEQAIHATKVLKEYLPYLDLTLAAVDTTYLFEIIYPDNRIVVNYGDMDDLVLLGAVDRQHGYYFGPQSAAATLQWPGQSAEVFYAPDFVSALSLPDREGKEGYIIRSGTKIVKLKQADYVELHRIVTNLSPKTVWQMLGDGKTVDQICDGIPDEFYDYVKDIADDLNMQASAIKFEATIEFAQAKDEAWSKTKGAEVSRRTWAESIKKRNHQGLLFSMLDDKPVDDMIWRMVKPRGDVKSLVEDDG